MVGEKAPTDKVVSAHSPWAASASLVAAATPAAARTLGNLGMFTLVWRHR